LGNRRKKGSKKGSQKKTNYVGSDFFGSPIWRNTDGLKFQKFIEKTIVTMLLRQWPVKTFGRTYIGPIRRHTNKIIYSGSIWTENAGYDRKEMG